MKGRLSHRQYFGEVSYVVAAALALLVCLVPGRAAEQAKEPVELKGHTDWVTSLEFSPDGELLASASQDKTVRLWNVKTGECLAVLRGHRDRVFCVTFSPKGDKLVSCDEDESLLFWDVASQKMEGVIDNHVRAVNKVRFSPDGSKLASCGQDETIRIWDAKTHAIVAMMVIDHGVAAVAFAPDGKLIAACGGSVVKIWDATNWKEIKSIAHADSVSNLVFSKDGKQLACGNWDKLDLDPPPEFDRPTHSAIYIWNTDTWREEARLMGHQSYIGPLIFSQDGGRLLSSGPDGVFVWDVASKRVLIKLTHESPTSAAALSADGQLIAHGTQEGTIYLETPVATTEQ